MIIHSIDGTPLILTPDNRVRSLSVTEPIMHAMAELGKAWTLPFMQTGAANTTDNVVFHFKNDSDNSFDIHRVDVSSAEPGLWSVYSGRSYAADGTPVVLAQLSTSSGRTQDMTAYYGTAISLTGTATLIASRRTAADSPRDVLADIRALQIDAGDEFEIRFQADTGNNVMTVTVYTHGVEPWEDE